MWKRSKRPQIVNGGGRLSLKMDESYGRKPIGTVDLEYDDRASCALRSDTNTLCNCIMRMQDQSVHVCVRVGMRDCMLLGCPCLRARYSEYFEYCSAPYNAVTLRNSATILLPRKDTGLQPHNIL